MNLAQVIDINTHAMLHVPMYVNACVSGAIMRTIRMRPRPLALPGANKKEGFAIAARALLASYECGLTAREIAHKLGCDSAVAASALSVMQAAGSVWRRGERRTWCYTLNERDTAD